MPRLRKDDPMFERHCVWCERQLSRDDSGDMCDDCRSELREAGSRWDEFEVEQ